MHPFQIVRHRKLWLLIGLVAGTLLLSVLVATAQGPKPGQPSHAASNLGTGFTYQGQLKSSGAPVNGTCGFQFALYDALSLGTQVGVTLTAMVPVTGGLFTTALDFGLGAFTGDARWLDIQALCPGDSVYTALTPRQALTPAPMALALPGLWTQQNATSPNVIGGYSGNVISPSVVGATIGGGGLSGNPNRAWGNYAAVGGGKNNTASGYAATVGGGESNTTSNNYATVGGGNGNTASGTWGTVGGGEINGARSEHATIGGGAYNTASNNYATVGGGNSNLASGVEATVAGGRLNNASNTYATVGGGNTNLATGVDATVSGGTHNNASSDHATVGGGGNNTASGYIATVGGGELNIASNSWATISGGFSNTVTNAYATVGGGNSNLATGVDATVSGGTHNKASNDHASVGGGGSNTASGYIATVGGGELNIASSSWATVGGGQHNAASQVYATVPGGLLNNASKDYATVGGGANNTASGTNATVPGGDLNVALGQNSFAAGHRAKALHQGAFVWADSDSSNSDFASTAPNQFLVHASGGITLYSDVPAIVGVALLPGSGSWSMVSDRNAKANFNEVDGRAIVAQLATLPMQTWNYKTQDAAIRHIGPMAQDFHAAFGVGENDTTISTVDAQGVAFAAIQGLHQVVQEKDAQIAAQQKQISELQKQNASVEARLTALEERANSVNPAANVQPVLLALGTLVMLGVVYRRHQSGHR